MCENLEGHQRMTQNAERIHDIFAVSLITRC